ncbi:hypothetical protein FD725_28700 [Nostoc sp. TCL26-01]|nr:hypothetical protein FD725_28700 [Nostoc sp. TCL26-01]
MFYLAVAVVCLAKFRYCGVITVQSRILLPASRVCYGIVKKLRLALPITTLYELVTIARRKAVLIKHLPNKILN